MSFLFSKSFLTSRFMLWSLFWINLLGTIYGYIWYGDQLVFTMQTMPLWYVPFVPDSPTASLFFTLTVLILLVEDRFGWNDNGGSRHVRGIIEAFGLMTSVKYGIWAVTMIGSSAVLGGDINWQDWMLLISHLGMAAEALLFVRFTRYRLVHVILVACWSFANDYMDYGNLTYPWLPNVLTEHLGAVRNFTVTLSAVAVAVALACLPFNRTGRSRRF